MNWEEAYKIETGSELWLGGGMRPVLDFIEKAKSSGASRILDAACGDGRHLVTMARHPFKMVAGCDGSWRALELCRRRLQKENPQTADRVILMQSPLEDLLIKSSAFDCIVCVDALVHNTFEISSRIIAELHRCVRPGGRLLFNLCTDEEPTRFLPGMEPVSAETAWYTVQPAGPRYYYEFFSESRMKQLLDAAGIRLDNLHIQRFRWQDEAHEGFREYPHEHDGWFIEVSIGDR